MLKKFAAIGPTAIVLSPIAVLAPDRTSLPLPPPAQRRPNR